MLSSLNIFRMSRRSISLTAPMAIDQFHQLFLDKVREYRMRNPNGKPTEPTPEFEEALDKEFERLAKQFGGGDDWRTEMIKFPKFVIPDVVIDPISLKDHEKLKNQDIEKKSEDGDENRALAKKGDEEPLQNTSEGKKSPEGEKK